jgi:putative DNA primase/helicase
MHHQKTAHAANGKWRGILLELGLPAQSLTGKHGPCPMCEGTDRFRWDNAEGRGTFFCTHCGAGDGMDLALKYTGLPFQEVASKIDTLLGNIKFEPDKPKPVLSEEQRRDALRDVWKASVPVSPGDLVHKYLETRGIDQVEYAKALRFAPALRDGDGGVRPCMVAMVGRQGQDRFDTMHRTFLKPDGSGKAEMPSPRKMMPGDLPDGACVMLSDWTGTGALGIAEGIETAMSASAMFDMPVWAALTAGNLAKWVPPDGCEEVAIFGDNDPKFAGQAAAYALARRLAGKGIPVTVHIPKRAGTDWADEWLATRRRSIPC